MTGFARFVGLGRNIAAFVARDFAIARSYRLPFILDAFYGFLNLAVYYFVSQTFNGVHGKLDAPTYFAFASVGFVVATVTDTAGDSVAYKIRDEQLAGTLETLLAQPLSAGKVCLGSIAFPASFALVRASTYLTIAAFWMHLNTSRASWLGVVLMMLLTGAALATFGIVGAAVVLVLKRGEIIAAMALFAMSMLSGSVFPVSQLPNWLRPLARVLPLRYGLDGIRHALFGSGTWREDALFLGAFSVIALPTTVWIFGKALSVARRRGTIAQY